MTLTTAGFVGGDTCIKLIGVSLPLGEMICLIGLMSTVFLLIIYAQQDALGKFSQNMRGPCAVALAA